MLHDKYKVEFVDFLGHLWPTLPFSGETSWASRSSSRPSPVVKQPPKSCTNPAPTSAGHGSLCSICLNIPVFFFENPMWDCLLKSRKHKKASR